jgi:PEP-CTERM motif-containing protein
MKILIYSSVFVLLTLMSFPLTAEAFSRRTHHSELGQTQQTTQLNSQTRDVSPQAVPEPPALLLMGIGIGLLAIYSTIKRFRGRDASREKAL